MDTIAKLRAELEAEYERLNKLKHAHKGSEERAQDADDVLALRALAEWRSGVRQALNVLAGKG